eukprot:501576-Lingulodinium_polyedra.AAC.1
MNERRVYDNSTHVRRADNELGQSIMDDVALPGDGKGAVDRAQGLRAARQGQEKGAQAFIKLVAELRP